MKNRLQKSLYFCCQAEMRSIRWLESKRTMVPICRRLAYFCSPDRFHFISLLRATCLLEYNRAKPWFPPVWFLEAVHTGRGIQTGGFIGKKVILPSLWTRSRSTWELFWWPRGSVSPRGTTWAFADSVSSAERLHKHELLGGFAHQNLRCRPSKENQTRTRPWGSAQTVWCHSRRRTEGNHTTWQTRNIMSPGQIFIIQQSSILNDYKKNPWSPQTSMCIAKTVLKGMQVLAHTFWKGERVKGKITLVRVRCTYRM